MFSFAPSLSLSLTLSLFSLSLSLALSLSLSLFLSLFLYQARLASPAAALLAAALLAFSAFPAAEHAWTNSSNDAT